MHVLKQYLKKSINKSAVTFTTCIFIFSDPSSKVESPVKEKIDDYDSEKDAQRFPCILTMCGSAFALMKVINDFYS